MRERVCVCVCFCRCRGFLIVESLGFRWGLDSTRKETCSAFRVYGLGFVV